MWLKKKNHIAIILLTQGENNVGFFPYLNVNGVQNNNEPTDFLK